MRGFRVEKEQFIIQSIGDNEEILHVGCTNSPNTEKRWNSQTLLHKKICDQASLLNSHVTGIDIDDNDLNFLKKKMPDANIFHIDAHHLLKYFGNEKKFDLIIAGDVIEHLPNPGLFLESCREVLSPGGQIIITTVNGYGIVRFIKAFLFHEAVHNEHTAYYSHKTLDRLLYISGMRAVSRGSYKYEPVTTASLNLFISNLVESAICVIWPQFS